MGSRGKQQQLSSAIERCSFILPLSKSSHWLPVQEQGLTPSSAQPPLHCSILLPPGTSFHLPVPRILSPLLHQFGCHLRYFNVLPPKKKGYSLGGYASEVLGRESSEELQKTWQSRHYREQKQENIMKSVNFITESKALMVKIKSTKQAITVLKWNHKNKDKSLLHLLNIYNMGKIYKRTTHKSLLIYYQKTQLHCIYKVHIEIKRLDKL